jgi:hypothetical protein
MSKIRVTFDSDASAIAFADKWKISAPAGNSLDIDWHLAEDAVKDATTSSHEQLDASEHEFIVQGDRATLEEHGTVVADLGDGFFKMSSTNGVALASAADSIDDATGEAEFLASSISSMDPTATELDPTSAEGQWARIRVASTYRPLAPAYTMHDAVYLSKPELYLMDTGVESSHAEFQGTDLEIDTFWSLPGIWEAGDQKGHGTGVASMAVGKNLGITTNVKLRNIKIAGNKTDADGNLIDPGQPKSATVAELGDALDALLAHVLADANKTRILNCSWGVTRSAYLDAKFQALMDAGVTLVSAAGNSGIDVSLVTPAGITESLTIGATDKFDIPAGFNNIAPSDSGVATAAGLELDMFAPGDEVMTAHVVGAGEIAGQYGINSGTSYAAPLVSGIACVIGSMTDGLVAIDTMKSQIVDTGTKNALLFEDSTFTELQNNLAYVFTTDPLGSYKSSDMVSYLGVMNDDPIVADLNSNLGLTMWTDMYPTDTFTYTLEYPDSAVEAKYSPYITVDSATGIVTIVQAPRDVVVLPDDVKLDEIEFIGVATNSKVAVRSNKLFLFNSNPTHADTVNDDVTLALTDVNSISFFGYWSTPLK